jgi:hypothetical protein
MANEDEQIPKFLYGDGGIVHSFVPKLKQGGFLVYEATNELI